MMAWLPHKGSPTWARLAGLAVTLPVIPVGIAAVLVEAAGEWVFGLCTRWCRGVDRWARSKSEASET